jgi:hypothetical protein
MFTLKLFRRTCPTSTQLSTKIVNVDRVVSHEIGDVVDGKSSALELHAFRTSGADYDTYYVGKPSPGMEAFGKDDLHLSFEHHSWWGWGLLENWEGNTTQHFRPASYG